MAATVKIYEVTGPAGSKTYTEITGRVRLFTKDQATAQPPSDPQITYPVPIPSVGNFNYSYWKHVCLGVSGTFTKVDNIRHYCDGAIGWNYGTDGELRRGNRDSGDHGCPTANYERALGTEGTTGYTIEDVVNGHDYYNGQVTPTADIESDIAPNGVVIDSVGVELAGYCKMIVLQVKVDDDATSGVQPAETLTWKYDVID